MRARVAEDRRPDLEAVVVEERLSLLAVLVVDHRTLQGEPRHVEILLVQVGRDYVVLAQRLAHVVEPAVGVLLEALEEAEVVLPGVAVAVAEEAYPKRLVEEQEAAEV